MALHIIGPIILGLIIGVLEVFLLAKDEGMNGVSAFFREASHAFIVSIIATIIVSNVPLVLSYIPEGFRRFLFVDSQGRSWVLSLIMALIVKIKIVVVHKGIKMKGTNESFIHGAIIGLLVGFCPYYLSFVYNLPFIAGIQASIPWLPL